MRDKVLCRGWAETEKPEVEDEFFLCRRSYFLILTRFFVLLPSGYSVPVSVQGGVKMSIVKMSIDEVLSFFDSMEKSQGAQEFLEHSRQDFDTIFAAESLFKGTVLDFDVGMHSGGGNYARHDSAIN